MSKTLLVLFTIFLLPFFTIATHAQEATAAHKDSLQAIVEQYYDLNLKVFQQNSSKEDVDQLFDLFTDDFVYVHPKYGGEYSRQDLYEGYLNNQKNGNYDGSLTDVEVKNTIIGLNGLATERVYLKRAKSGQLEEVDPGMTVFEFKNGRISKVVEYW